MGVALPRPLTAECARDRAFTLRSPFGERGFTIPLCRDAVPTLPMEGITG